LITNRGLDDTIKQVKLIRLCTTRYICGQPLHDSGYIAVSLNKKGLPRALGKCQDLIENGDKNSLRLLMTLLVTSRALKGSRYLPELSTITDGIKYTPQIIEEIKYLIPIVMSMRQVNTTSKPS